MNFDKNLAAIHGYLCGDGYVIKNPLHQKHKYYHIGFRNTNDVLLKDFQNKFYSVFGLVPHITNEGRCRIQNKEIYCILTKGCSYYSYYWTLPKLSKANLTHWLRAFFDCEACVQNQPRKNRAIALDCCNKKGLAQIQSALKKFDIHSGINKRKDKTIWTLTICGLENIKRFNRKMGFLHPNKKIKLVGAINSYVDYNWKIPANKQDLLGFIHKKGRIRKSRKEIRFYSIKKKNLTELKKVLNKNSINSKLFGPWTNNTW